MKKLRGFTLIELLIVVAIIAILAAIAVPNFLEAQTRAKVARAQSDMRSLATALEAYYIDNNEYPAQTTNVNFSLDFSFYRTAPAQIGRTFRRSTIGANNRVLGTLTTPVSFITSNPADPFADPRGIGFLYFTDGPGWILSSLGPNGIDDLGFRNSAATANASGSTPVANPRRNDIETAYNSRIAQPSPVLIAGSQPRPSFTPAPPTGTASFTYDPTNGTTSVGNVYRVKQ